MEEPAAKCDLCAEVVKNDECASVGSRGDTRFTVCRVCLIQGVRVDRTPGGGCVIEGRPRYEPVLDSFDPRVLRTRTLALAPLYRRVPGVEHRVFMYCVRVPLDKEENRGGSYVVLADSPGVAAWAGMKRGVLGSDVPVEICSYILGEGVPYPITAKSSQGLTQFPRECADALLRVYFKGVEAKIRAEPRYPNG
jgi:hypothetical protein